MDTTTKRYGTRLAAGLAAYTLLLVIALIALRLLPTDLPARWAVMALPVPALVVVAWTIGRFVTRADELQSRIQLQAMALAFATGSLITFGYGLLQLAGAPQLSWMLVWGVYAVCWMVGVFVVRARY